MPLRTTTRRFSPLDTVRFLIHLPNFVRLYWRLFNDPRVSWFAKAFPIAALIYVIAPFDLLGDWAIPFIGAVDDIGVVWFALTAFIRLCPQQVVAEHVARIDRAK